MRDDAEVFSAAETSAVVSVRNAAMDEAMSVGGLVFHRHTLRPLDRAQPPRLDLRSFRTGPVTLGVLQYSRGAHVQSGAMPDGYQINIPLSGRLLTGRLDDTMVATSLRAAQYGLHPHGFEGFETPTRVLGVKIDSGALERRLETILGRGLGGAHIEFALTFPLTTPAGRDWFTVVQLLARRLWSPAGLAADSLVRQGLQEALLTGLLIASPHAYSDELRRPQRTADSAAVRRAAAYADSRPESAMITVPELAAASGVGVRALQAAFRKELDTTPLAFLRERRLTRARRMLEQADPAVVSVAEVADHCGFAHHGRFATDYRRRFGESPSETLRRS